MVAFEIRFGPLPFFTKFLIGIGRFDDIAAKEYPGMVVSTPFKVP
jgi:hypothetical protein